MDGVKRAELLLFVGGIMSIVILLIAVIIIELRLYSVG